MSEERRFPVLIVSVALALFVGLGLLMLVGNARAPVPAEPEGDVVREPEAPGALPPLPDDRVPRADRLPPGPAAAAGSAPTPSPDAPPDSPPRPKFPRTVDPGPTPTHPAATGVVYENFAPTGGRVTVHLERLTATIWRLDGRSMLPVTGATGLPVSAGEFAIRDLPDGDYLIEFVAEGGGQVVRAKREFRVAGYTADLGEVQLMPSTGIRARVVDVAGRPIEQADVVVVRPEEQPEQARRLVPDDQGWVTYQDLEPDLVHQVVVLGLPTRLERSVRTPSGAGEFVEAEFRSPLRQIPTTVAFYLDGELRELPYIEGLATDLGLKKLKIVDGVLTTWLLPGTYRFWTTDREGSLTVDDLDSVHAKVHLHPKPADAPEEEEEEQR